MAFFIILVVMLAALSGVVVTRVASLPIEDYQAEYASRQLDIGLLMLEGSVQGYLNHSRDDQGRISYPGDDVELALAPLHGYMPADQLHGIQWQVRTGHYKGEPAIGICVAPLTNSAITGSAVGRVAASLPESHRVLATDCFAQRSQEGGATLTYWLEVLAFEQPLPRPLEPELDAGEPPALEASGPGKTCSPNGNCYGHIKKPKPGATPPDTLEPSEVGYTGSPGMERYATSRKKRCSALQAEPLKNPGWSRLLQACLT